MLDACRFSLHKDILEYEKQMEVVSPMTPPFTKSRPPDVIEQPIGRPQPTKYKCTRADGSEYLASFHAVPY